MSGAGIRRSLAWALAIAPACVLLAPSWRPGRLLGVADGGAWPALHALTARAEGWSPPAPVPALSGAPPADPLAPAWLVPLADAVGAAAALDALAALGLVGGAAAVYAWLGRGRSKDTDGGWIAVAGAWACTTQAAVLHALADGRPQAAQIWALVALLLVDGPVALGLGAALGALAAPLLPAALALAGLEAFAGGLEGLRAQSRAWAWRGAGAAIALAVALSAEGIPRPPVAPGDLFGRGAPSGWVGGGPMLLAMGLLASGRGAARRWAGGSLALTGLALAPTVGGGVLVAVAPALARGARAAGPSGVVAVLVGAAIVAEGTRAAGLGPTLPTVEARPEAPRALASLPAGPILELPLSRSAARRALAMQLQHRRAIAVDSFGQPVPDAMDLGRAFASGACPDPGALGYVALVVRREGELRHASGLSTCLGPPLADDGVEAVWSLVATEPRSR